jgi:FkbM family methyltransferase
MQLTITDLPFRLKRKFHKIMGTRHVRTRYGVVMRANWQDATFRMCYNGSYGTALSDLIAQRRDDFLFLDIGANQGLYSLLAARNPRCQQAYAFEPVAQTHRLLLDNIAANGFQALITPVPAAMSNSTGTATITLRATHSGAASLESTSLTHGGAVETIRTLDIAAVDALVRPDGAILVKIDVEGHETVVIDQLMMSQHRRRIAAIFYEVDEAWHDPSALEAALRAGGFSHFIRHGTGTHYDVLALRNAGEASGPRAA